MYGALEATGRRRKAMAFLGRTQQGYLRKKRSATVKDEKPCDKHCSRAKNTFLCVSYNKKKPVIYAGACTRPFFILR